MDVLAGVSLGSWMEAAVPYADLDLWAGLELRRPGWNSRIEGWSGWTEDRKPEAGVSGIWEFKGRWNGWEFRQGPGVRLSWRRSRYLGWSAQASTAVLPGVLELAGAVRARQDPSWPVVQGYDSVPVKFARERAQATVHVALARTSGALDYGPSLDLDGRMSFAPDRWSDSGSGSAAVVARSERRSDLGCTAGVFLRWNPSSIWSADGALGWTWSAQGRVAGLDVSPFSDGPSLRLGARSSF